MSNKSRFIWINRSQDLVDHYQEETYRIIIQCGQNLLDKQMPPTIQVLGLIDGHIARNGLCVQIVAVVPRLLSADEVHDLDRVLELFVGRCVAVRGVCGHVVGEWEASIGVGGRPIAEEGVEKALIATIEAALTDGEC